jgi:uncharacterized protein (DUF983 family)
MPSKQGTGSRGQRPGQGGSAVSATGQGRQQRRGVGPGGYCICPNCGEQALHQTGMPCYQQVCPKCGAKMTRG